MKDDVTERVLLAERVDCLELYSRFVENIPPNEKVLC